MSDNESRDISQQSEFERQAQLRRPSFLSEYIYLLKTNKKWWLLPLILLILLFGALMILSSTGAAPFIYTLF